MPARHIVPAGGTVREDELRAGNDRVRCIMCERPGVPPTGATRVRERDSKHTPCGDDGVYAEVGEAVKALHRGLNNGRTRSLGELGRMVAALERVAAMKNLDNTTYLGVVLLVERVRARIIHQYT